MYSIGGLLGGIVVDKLGLFYGQIFNFIPNVIGLICFAFIDDNESLIWAGWPVACLGMCGQHFMNMQFCRLSRKWL